MKLATIDDGSRDGKLIIVNRQLTMALAVPEIAQTMQQALDNWHICKPKLEAIYKQLNMCNHPKAMEFEVLKLSSPFPRSYQWADGSAYVNHVELVRKARGAEMPANFWHDPLIYQGGSDTFLGPHDNIPLIDESVGMDFESEIAVVTTDVPLGADKSTAANHICLLMLVNDVSLRNLIPDELAKSFGFFQSKPSSTFSPVAVTPDELGAAWDGSKVHLPLHTYFNNKLFGAPHAGTDMTFDFPTLVAHAAKTRRLGAGTIIGSGTVSNYDRSKGSSCIAEVRMLEILEHGKPITPFMKVGDAVRIEMFNENNESIFGAINQIVTPAEV